MTKTNTSQPAIASSVPSPREAFDAVRSSFDRFCLISGIAVLEEMQEEDTHALCGGRYDRADDRKGHRWGVAQGSVGFQGGKTKVKRPRVRGKDGKEIPLPSWTAAQEEDWLGTRGEEGAKRATGKQEMGDEPDADQCLDAQIWPHRAPARWRYPGEAWRRNLEISGFAALSAAKMKKWMMHIRPSMLKSTVLTRKSRPPNVQPRQRQPRHFQH